MDKGEIAETLNYEGFIGARACPFQSRDHLAPPSTRWGSGDCQDQRDRRQSRPLAGRQPTRIQLAPLAADWAIAAQTVFSQYLKRAPLDRPPDHESDSHGKIELTDRANPNQLRAPSLPRAHQASEE